MIQVALLSKWHVHAEGYGKEFAAIPGVKVTVIWDEDPVRGKAWAEKMGCEFEPDLAKVLARPDVDAVSVNTATGMHKEVILAAAKAGKAIFTEKVLTFDTASAEETAAGVKAAGVPFLISFPKRGEARIRYAKKLIESGAIGQITHMRVRNAHDGASANWLPDTFYDVKQCGGGAMMDLGAHPMYLCLYLMGEPKTVSSVFTQVAGKGVDDNCVSVLSYENGAIAVSETAFVSSACPFSLELNGTGGSLFISDTVGVILNTKEGTRQISAEEMGESQPGPVEIFVDCLKENKPSPYTIDDAVALTRLMEAAYKSAETGAAESVFLF